VKLEAAVAVRGALGTARPTCASVGFDATELSVARVGRGVLTAPGLKRTHNTATEVHRLEARMVEKRPFWEIANPEPSSHARTFALKKFL
jgi:hypothetical protein